MLETLTMTPLSPFSSLGDMLIYLAAYLHIKNTPIKLISMTFLKALVSCILPFKSKVSST